MSFSRLRHTLKTPGFHRTRLLRSLLAGALVLLAVAVAALGQREEQVQVLVFRQEVAAGSTVDSTMLEQRMIPAHLAPDASLSSLDEAEDRIVGVQRSQGSIATQADFIDNALISSVEGDYHLVPMRLADAGVLSLLAPGDAVSVLTAGGEAIASGALVVYVPEATEKGARQDTVLLALPAGVAQNVAAHTLDGPLAVVITGERAHK